VLSHSPECREVGTRKVKGSRITAPCNSTDMQSGYGGKLAGPRPARGIGDADGMETVTAWDCAPDCAVRLLDEQSGERRARGNVTPTKRNGGSWFGAEGTPGPVDGGDTGGASRFFLNVSMSRRELLLHRAKAIFEAWNPDFASTADGPSSLSSQHAASALSDAVTLASHGATSLRNLTGLSTSVTASELRMLCEAAIALTLHSASASSPESPPTRPTPSASHASDAGTHGPTDTTTITADLSRFGGSAVVVTLSATAMSGGAGAKDSASSRAYYTAKASRRERNQGLPEGMTNTHPTVKSVALARWLCRLVCPPGGHILDPFMGSGSLGVGALLEGFHFIGIEREADYCLIGQRRLAYWERVARRYRRLLAYRAAHPVDRPVPDPADPLQTSMFDVGAA
jgi:hypothetical protein